MRKRELVAERWCRHIIAHEEYFAEHPEARAGWSEEHVKGCMYEAAMAEEWIEHGMQVYDFDHDFSKSILSEKWGELLPDLLKYAPHECFYMKLPIGKMSEGTFIAITDVDGLDDKDELPQGLLEKGKGVYRVMEGGSNVVVNTGEEWLCVQIFAVPKTFEALFDDTEIEFYTSEFMANALAYLCSENADIVPSYKPQKERRRNNAKRRSAATWHDVGYRIGSDLRAYNRVKKAGGEHQGGTVRPHMRRAHWHHYWVGPMDGERRLVLKWVAPTMVGVGDIESATGHKVGKAVAV